MTAVENVKRESATGIDRARGCLRKWAFGAIDGLKEPFTADNARGGAIHAMQEAWLRDGTAPREDESPIYRTLHSLARSHLPAPKLCTCEEKVTYTIDDIDYSSVIDAYWYDVQGKAIYLYDHKSSKWAPNYCLRKKTDYLDDTQFVLYAKHLFDKFPAATRLSGAWVYYKVPHDDPKKPERDAKYKPAVYSWPAIVWREDVETAFREIVAPVAQKLVQLRSSGLTAKQITPNVDHCDEYGGCYYRKEDHCSPMGEEMSDMEDLFADLDGVEESKPELRKSEPPKAKPEPKSAKAETKRDVVNPPEKPAAAAATKRDADAPCDPNEGSPFKFTPHNLFSVALELNRDGVIAALREIVKAHI
jgi:hypothetical protein